MIKYISMGNNKLGFIKKQSMLLLVYDLLVVIFCCFLILYLYLHLNANTLSIASVLVHSLLFIVILFVSRFAYKIYSQIWRYGDVSSYIRLLAADVTALIVYYILERLLPFKEITFTETISLFSINLLIALTARIVYRYCYKYKGNDSSFGKLLGAIITFVSFGGITNKKNNENSGSIPVAILGAGVVGAGLANDFIDNKNTFYLPNMFLDVDKSKVGRRINNIPIFSEDISKKIFDKYGIQEVIFTVDLPVEKKTELYKRYKDFGLRIKTYDLPVVHNGDEERQLREFDPEELLFRREVLVVDDKTINYYKDKVILITGGGGSIGSEMARQVAKMKPKKLILLDIYENGVYDIEQELKFAYKQDIDVNVEICNICDLNNLEKVFNTYKPQIIIHAAAHKHVPLMEHNICEAISNNVFGTLNTVKLSEKYKAQRFIMISTDKAVNPTNVMGATKRMCEMIVKAYSNKGSDTTYSMTRFGNVLGSAGSVIPMFKRQIKDGGPITITDKRIIRFFMTIPEASQLVLKSGAMANNGELFVLDMGKPVKILDLAINMIKMSGLTPYQDIDIKEIGLRPGEKLYEELLIESETLTKTDDKSIFIEYDEPLPMETINDYLDILNKAVKENDDSKAKLALKSIVSTYKDPSEVNKNI